ncbi:DUF1189 domain-containing protein [Halalkalibacter urbisdiaboli]|uniref:DUF1189 domain-containing protein n=1 Tax=Halalkalibacter urbisdiaboli TaxID=1960589 RepID=UPI000B44477C|nr:DUF1189 domain-containing protein [Halalkalibacter urbisdiaboli]
MKFFHSFFNSLYNLQFLALSRFQPITKSIVHVLFYLMIACLPFVIVLSMTLTNGVKQLQSILISDLPPFHLENGKLRTNSAEPYLNFEVIEGVFILDPANHYSKNALFELGEGIAFQEQEAVLFNYSVSQTIPYTIIGDLDKEALLTWLNNLEGFLPLLIIIISLLSYSAVAGVAFLGITLLAAIGLLLRGRRHKLHYRHLWLMSAYSTASPVIVFAWLDIIAPVSIHPVFLILVTLFLLWLIIMRTPKGKPKL